MLKLPSSSNHLKVDFLAQTLNKRLGTQGLSVVEAYAEAQKRGIELTGKFSH